MILVFNKKLGIRIFYHFTNGPQDDNGQCYHKSVFSDHKCGAITSYTKHVSIRKCGIIRGNIVL